MSKIVTQVLEKHAAATNLMVKESSESRMALRVFSSLENGITELRTRRLYDVERFQFSLVVHRDVILDHSKNAIYKKRRDKVNVKM